MTACAAGNRSTAVMARRLEPHDSLDFFPTPPWATRALCEHVIGIAGHVVFDPACGDGAMVKAFRDYGPLAIFASDVDDYGRGFPVRDFLFGEAPPCDWVITNPPFRLAEQFIVRGLEIAEKGVAVLVRSVFAESVGRYRRLFHERPPALIAQFTERVPMVKGRLDENAVSATAYCWMVWLAHPDDPPGVIRREDTHFVWIPPCRKQLERPGDYA